MGRRKIGWSRSSGGRDRRLRHDQAVRDLDWLNQEHLRLTGERETLRDIPAQLERVRAEKRALLIAQGGETGRRLEELEEQLAAPARRLPGDRGGTPRRPGGRIAPGAGAGRAEERPGYGGLGHGGRRAVRDHGKARLHQRRPGRHQPCPALPLPLSVRAGRRGAAGCPQVEIGEFATFADCFFDGLFADWVVQSGIRDAQDNVDQVYRPGAGSHGPAGGDPADHRGADRRAGAGTGWALPPAADGRRAYRSRK